jgi:hypothetical protein
MSKEETTSKRKRDGDWPEYYDSRGVTSELVDKDIDLTLDDELREAILTGKREHKLASRRIS